MKITKHDAEILAREATQVGWVFIGYRHYGSDDWGVDCRCPTSGIPVTFYGLEEYRGRKKPRI